MNLYRNASIVAALIGGTLLALPAASAPQMARPNLVQQVPNIGAILGLRSVSCTVSGTPVEFPDDVRLRNTGTVTLAAGTSISWYLHANAHGVHTLAAALAPNQYAFLGGVLPGGWPAGAGCSATIL